MGDMKAVTRNDKNRLPGGTVMEDVKRFFANAGDIWLAYIMFIVFSIPIVTLGATLPALVFTLMQIERGKLTGKVSECFIRAFKQNLKQGTVIFWCYAVVSALITMGILHANAMGGEGIWQFVKLLCWGLAIPVIVSLSYLFGVEARFMNAPKSTIIYSLVMPLKNKVRALIIIATIVVCTALSICVPVFGIVLATVLAPIILYIFALLYNRTFACYIPADMRTERENEYVKNDKEYQAILKRQQEMDQANADIEYDPDDEVADENAKEADSSNENGNFCEVDLSEDTADKSATKDDDNGIGSKAADGSDKNSAKNEKTNDRGRKPASDKATLSLQEKDDDEEEDEEQSAPQQGRVISRYPAGYQPQRKHSLAEIVSMTSNEADDDDDEDEDDDAEDDK